MVRSVLRRWFPAAKVLCLVSSFLLFTPDSPASKRSKETTVPQPKPPDLLMDGGRRLTFENSFSLEREVKPKRSLFAKIVDAVAGEPDYRYLVNPYSVAVDSRGRIIISDPGALGVHVFDFNQHKYKFLTRRDKDHDPMLSPQCVAVDAHDNIYVTDSEAGKIFVFEPSGKYQRVVGSLKGGEGMFKRPTGIAVDSSTERIYVTDTLRDKIFVLDMQGSVLKMIGKRGSGNLEFNFPTELRLRGQDLVVVDAMNSRIQVLTLDGEFKYAIGKIGDGLGTLFRPKGIAFDSEGHLYVVDGLWGMVQVFDEQGRLLYYFGQKGSELGSFQLPAGLQIDKQDRIYVVDSFNRRVQIFHYYGSKQENETRR